MKKRFLTLILSLTAMLMCIFSLTACGGIEFKVNFVVDGEVYAAIDTNGQEIIKMPENPSKENYTFDGWFWDKDVWEKPFTANSLLDAPLSSDMSVYAKFSLIHNCDFKEKVASDIYKATGATCENKATYYFSCSCGEKGTETFKSGVAQGHSFTNYISDNNATCEVDGTKTAVCNRNGCNKTDTITDVNSKLGHSYGDWISIGNGQHKKTCVNDNNHNITENCSGGTATCTEKAICDFCNQEYGDYDNNNHPSTNRWVYDTKHHWKNYLCGHINEEKQEHEYINGSGRCFCGNETFTSVSFTKSVFYGVVGERVIVNVTGNNPFVYDFEYDFISSNDNVIRIEDNKVMAVRAGTANLTIVIKGTNATATCEIIVYNIEHEDTPLIVYHHDEYGSHPIIATSQINQMIISDFKVNSATVEIGLTMNVQLISYKYGNKYSNSIHVYVYDENNTLLGKDFCYSGGAIEVGYSYISTVTIYIDKDIMNVAGKNLRLEFKE